ncbi:MAG: hypothetical protein KAW41_06055 [Candidatus Diapherotrites archaeon]|nr:hypothetical protein [Candidatus Diapherotrites archaeon]
MKKRPSKPGKRAPEKYSLAENGVLTPKRRKRVDSSLKRLDNRWIVRSVRGLGIKMHVRSMRFDLDGKVVRARLAGLTGGVAGKIFPPHMDATRAVLTAFGGKKGRAEAKEIKESQVERKEKKILKHLDDQVKHIVEKNGWHLSSEEIIKLKRVKNKMGDRRARAAWFMDHPAYWISLATMLVPVGKAGKGVAIKAAEAGVAELLEEGMGVLGREAVDGIEDVTLDTVLEDGSIRFTEAGLKDAPHTKLARIRHAAETHYLEHKLNVALGHTPSLASRVKGFPEWYQKQRIAHRLTDGELTEIQAETKEKRDTGFVFCYNHQLDSPTVSFYSLVKRGHNYEVIGKDVRVRGTRVKIRLGPMGNLHADGPKEVTRTFPATHGTVQYLPQDAEHFEQYVVRQLSYIEGNKKKRERLTRRVMEKLGKHLAFAKEHGSP